MDHAPAVRKLPQLAAAGLFALFLAALPGCSSIARTVVVDDSQVTTVALISRSSPTLTLRSRSADGVDTAPQSDHNGILKVASNGGMQALLDTFDDQQLFQHASGAAPGNARQALVLRHGGQTWAWVFASNPNEPRGIAFLQARSFFLQLFNGSQTYRPPQGEPDLREAERRAKIDAVRRRYDNRSRGQR